MPVFIEFSRRIGTCSGARLELKRFNREILFKERMRVYVTVPLLLLGNGNFPRWYKKLKKVVYNGIETNNS